MRPAVELRPAFGPAPAGGIPVSSLRLRRSVDWPVGQVVAELPGDVEPPEPGAALTLSAAPGRDDSPGLLFTGRALGVTRRARSTTLVIEEATGPLTRLRVDATFTSATAATVIQDLVGRAQVQAQVEGTGAQLPFFAVLANRTIMDHLLHLAFLSGFRLTTTTAGLLKASAVVGPGAAAAALAGAAQAYGPGAGPVVMQSASAFDGEPPGPTLTGDGALTKQGVGADAWVLKDVSAMQSGDGPVFIPVPALKTPADLKVAQIAWQQRLTEAARPRRLTLMGPPPGDLGDVITLKGFAAGDGPARIAGIALLWGAQTGLQSQLTLHGLA